MNYVWTCDLDPTELMPALHAADEPVKAIFKLWGDGQLIWSGPDQRVPWRLVSNPQEGTSERA